MDARELATEIKLIRAHGTQNVGRLFELMDKLADAVLSPPLEYPPPGSTWSEEIARAQRLIDFAYMSRRLTFQRARLAKMTYRQIADLAAMTAGEVFNIVNNRTGVQPMAEQAEPEEPQEDEDTATGTRVMYAYAKAIAVYYEAEKAFMVAPDDQTLHEYHVAHDRWVRLRDEVRGAYRLGDALFGTEDNDSVGTGQLGSADDTAG